MAAFAFSPPDAGATEAGVRLLAKLKASGPCGWTECDKRARLLHEEGLRVSSKFRNMRHLLALKPVAPTLQRAVQDEERLCKELMASGLFEYVEPDVVLARRSLPSDAAFVDGRLWALRNDGQSGGVSGVDVGATGAWAMTTGSRDVIVGIVDAGIRYTHLDVRDNLWINTRETPDNNRDDDGNGYVDDVYGINAIRGSGNPMDDDGHGTHVAATIGATANSGGPQVGLAWNVRLMALKFLDRDGYGYTSDAVECLDYAISQGVDIINASWGSYSYSRSLFDAVSRCRDAGILVVAAAGNEGLDSDRYPSYPANFAIDNVVAVAAVDRRGRMADFSNFGAATVHLAAPGVAIFSAVASHDQAYDFYSGTSMAAPHVAGAAALLRSADQDVAPWRMRQLLVQGVTPLVSLTGRSVSGGMLNAYGSLAIQAGITYQPPVVESFSSEVYQAGNAWRQGAAYYREEYRRLGAPQLAEAYYYYYEGMAQFTELSQSGRHTQALAHYYLYLSFYNFHFHSHFGLYASAWYYFWHAQALGYYFWSLSLSDPAGATRFYEAYLQTAQNYWSYLQAMGFQ